MTETDEQAERRAPHDLSCLSRTEVAAIPIACRIEELRPEERARERELLREHLASFVEVRECREGHSYRYPEDSGLAVRMAELITLEHRCCPFLSFALEWPAAGRPPWLHVRGVAAAKDFIASTFGSP